VAALQDDRPSGVPLALASPLTALLRGVDSRGAQGEVRGLLLRAEAGAALDRIFWRFSVACTGKGGGGGGGGGRGPPGAARG
jgi:hypothetical protein